jgi:hypothetical protein
MTEATFLRWLFSYDDCACARMVLHDPDRITNRFKRQCWQGSGQGMQLHEKRCIKRAGVAGIALRAGMEICLSPLYRCRLSDKAA